LRIATIIASAVIHAVVGMWLLHAAKIRARRVPVSIAVFSSPRKPIEVKAHRRALPTPPKPHASAVPLRAAAAAVTATAPSRTLIDTHYKMGNVEEPGMDVGGAPPEPRPLAAVESEKPKLLARAPKPQVASTQHTTEDCTEEPTKPVVLARPNDIEYTQKARADGVEGRLVLQVIVAADGSVAEVKVARSVEPALDAAAIAAVQTWRFRPATQCGKPVAGGVYTIAQRFELGD
jgi:protein TonB